LSRLLCKKNSPSHWFSVACFSLRRRKDFDVHEFVLIFLANAASIFVLIVVHETDHFLAGWVGGIPVCEMRIRLLTFPQHVALRDGKEWVTQFDLERSVAISVRGRNCSSTRRVACSWVWFAVRGEVVMQQAKPLLGCVEIRPYSRNVF
jgi:hypothetical protein